MSRNYEDIIEIKPGIWGFNLNLRAFWRRMAGNTKPSHTEVVTQRFIQIFNDHGVATTEIPRLIPEVTLEKLESHESLLLALTNEVIDKVADLFLVKKSWLEGNSSAIYDGLYCYKQPHRFFEELSKIKLVDIDCPVIAFTSRKTLDCNSGREQPIRIIFEERCAQIGDKVIRRYVIWNDKWDWGYWKTRIQLKALVRLTDIKLIAPVTIYHVDPETLNKLENGKIVPNQVLLNSRRLPFSLEDFTESYEEHKQAKELEDLPNVMEYVEDHKLEDLADSLLEKRR